MKNFLLILAMAALVVACSKKNEEPNYLTSVESVKEHIQGSWSMEYIDKKGVNHSEECTFFGDSVSLKNDFNEILCTYTLQYNKEDIDGIPKGYYIEIAGSYYDLFLCSEYDMCYEIWFYLDGVIQRLSDNHMDILTSDFTTLVYSFKRIKQ